MANPVDVCEGMANAVKFSVKSDKFSVKNGAFGHNPSKSGSDMNGKVDQNNKIGAKVSDLRSQPGTDVGRLDLKSCPQVSDGGGYVGGGQIRGRLMGIDQNRGGQIRGSLDQNKSGQIGGGPIKGGGQNSQLKIPRGEKIVRGNVGLQNLQNKGSGWLPPLRAKRIYMRRGVLTKHEEIEILDYPRIYFTGQSAIKVPGTDNKAPNKGFDDEEGCYRFVTHDHIAYRYGKSLDMQVCT